MQCPEGCTAENDGRFIRSVVLYERDHFIKNILIELVVTHNFVVRNAEKRAVVVVVAMVD